MQNGCDSVTVVTVWKMNTTETQPKPQNASHCHKPHCHNACASLRATQSMKPLLEAAMKPRTPWQSLHAQPCSHAPKQIDFYWLSLYFQFTFHWL